MEWSNSMYVKEKHKQKTSVMEFFASDLSFVFVFKTT